MSVEIPLGNGVSAVVDDVDGIAALFYATWRYENGYVLCDKPKERGKKVFLHNFIGQRMGIIADVKDVGKIDHTNRNPLDCRRENLRFSSRNQNNANSETKSDSGFRGVYKHNKKWKAIVGETYLGVFETAEKAARAYDVVAKKKFGEFAILNFPEVSS
jgi:hypothetical protein